MLSMANAKVNTVEFGRNVITFVGFNTVCPKAIDADHDFNGKPGNLHRRRKRM